MMNLTNIILLHDGLTKSQYSFIKSQFRILHSTNNYKFSSALLMTATMKLPTKPTFITLINTNFGLTLKSNAHQNPAHIDT